MITARAQSLWGSSPPGIGLTKTTQGEKDIHPLEAGKPIERELARGQAHSYHITLASGQYLYVVIDQRGIDVVVALFGPDGKKLAEVDSPNGNQGPEPVPVIAQESGRYRLEVRSLEETGAAGRYEVRIEQLRIATTEDRNRVAAQNAFAEGEQLRGQGTAESLGKSIKRYEEALPLWRILGDRTEEATTLHNIGSVYYDLGEKQKALDYFNRALAISRQISDRRGEATTLSNIGLVYHSLGEKQKALDYYLQALAIRQETGDRRGEAITLNNIGGVYIDLGEKQKALDYLNQSLPLSRQTGNRRGEANSLHNIGGVYIDLGEKRKALDHLNQSLAISRLTGDRRGEGTTLGTIGLVYHSLGEKQKALDYLNQSLAISRQTGDRRGEANSLHNIGSVYIDLGEKQKALDHLNQALPLRRAVGDHRGEAQTLYDIARVELDLGNLIEARSQIEAALNIIESLRTKIASPDLRASYFASAQKHYELYIDLLMRLHKLRPSDGHDSDAIKAVERARARSLLDLLTEARADIRQGVDQKLLERERSLHQLLIAKAERRMRLLSGRHNQQQATEAEKEIEALTTDYQQVQSQIRATSPRYAALTQPQPLSLPEIQQVLDSDTLLLEFALGDERSYLWSVTPSSMTSYELPKRAEIETAARLVYDLLTARNRDVKSESVQQKLARVAQADAQYPKAAAALSRMLLGPVASQLAKKRLVIVSDGALQYVPFAALPLPQGSQPRTASSAGQPGKEKTVWTPLIVDHEIVSLPSISTLAVLRRELSGRTPAPKTVAVLADPVFEKNDPRVRLGTQDRAANQAASSAGVPANELAARSIRETGVSNQGLVLPRLPFSRQEAMRIGALVPPSERKQALDFQANRATAISRELSQYRIVHFATHGLLNSVHPEQSAIVLSLIDQRGTPQDGFLWLHEVYNLNLPAELIVLSACQTALGKQINGEGLVGLTRGFMYAGAARVMASLWKVNDKATADLMKLFYEAMLGQQRLSPAAALRHAQTTMWRGRRSQAYYWAAFVLQGEWR